jgi:hypothetical protein
MLSQFEGLIRRIALRSTRPDWTLFAISHLFSAAIVLILRTILGD